MKLRKSSMKDMNPGMVLGTVVQGGLPYVRSSTYERGTRTTGVCFYIKIL